MRIETGTSFLDPRRPARLAAARALLYALLGAIENKRAVLIHGIPPCFMPDAREHLRPGADGRPAPFCGSCRFAGLCPGPPPGSDAAGEAALRAWLTPIPDHLEEVAIETTGFCNLRCTVCVFGGSRRVQPSADELRRVIDEAAGAGVKTVRFTGGEPLVRADIYSLLDYAKESGLAVFLNTNGVLLGRRALARLERLADSVLVSVQGCDAETEERLTGGGRRFAAKLDNLRNLAGSKVPDVRVNTIVSRTLLSRREDYVSVLKRAGVTSWIPTRPLHAPASAAGGEYGLTRAEFLDALRFLSGLAARGIRAQIGNAVPLCLDDVLDDGVLFAANPLAEGASRLVYDCRGYYKPTYEIDVPLGRDLARARRHPFLRSLLSPQRLPPDCAGCVRLKDCLGGCRYMARQTGGDWTARDPLMR
ncbi:MAG: radical SAM protein [Elusimicrobia bacterium]|nr:radical SAM protein [Elusimicrobiota bacterium]